MSGDELGLPLISVVDLDFAYEVDGRQIEILRQVNLTINRGEFVAIQGPSGSGKSTLFYILGCLLQPTRGHVYFDGADITGLDGPEAAYLRNRKVGFVFQQFHLLPRATVLDNIMLPARYPQELPPQGEDLRAKAIRLAERLGLGDRLWHHPSQLSGGQQQRVAIARALLTDAPLILADEPTGNLDSRSAGEIMEILSELHAQGRTIVMITHDHEVARRAQRILHVRDGIVTEGESPRHDGREISKERLQLPKTWSNNAAMLAGKTLPGALKNLVRSRTKSILTMLGIIIGIAAVQAMISLGEFTKDRIMEGFEALGVNKLVVRGYPNWERRASDETRREFAGFSVDSDLAAIRRVFSEIRYLSPVLSSWQNTATAGGRSVSENVRLRGVNHEYAAITNIHMAEGRWLTPYHVEHRSLVCVLGSELATQLFPSQSSIGQMITVVVDADRSVPCRVIGVAKPQKSNQEWNRPNSQISMPYTVYEAVGSYFSSRMYQFAVQVRSESDVELVARKIKAYFNLRYGKSGRFMVDTEGTLVAQTKRFLTIFAALLTAIAFLSLLVGGIGIHNMMLVSVTERIKEIGLRKALGATNRSIRMQVLMESLVLCSVAGLIGIGAGFAATELMIFAATKFVPKLKFEWVFEPLAILTAVGSIVAVGVFSGLFPARRAERLQVIEALRAE